MNTNNTYKLTEEQKQHNRQETQYKLIQIALEYIMNNGGNKQCTIQQ